MGVIFGLFGLFGEIHFGVSKILNTSYDFFSTLILRAKKIGFTEDIFLIKGEVFVGRITFRKIVY
jgi:hypothetical protein